MTANSSVGAPIRGHSFLRCGTKDQKPSRPCSLRFQLQGALQHRPQCGLVSAFVGSTAAFRHESTFPKPHQMLVGQPLVALETTHVSTLSLFLITLVARRPPILWTPHQTLITHQSLSVPLREID